MMAFGVASVPEVKMSSETAAASLPEGSGASIRSASSSAGNPSAPVSGSAAVPEVSTTMWNGVTPVRSTTSAIRSRWSNPR